jgi:hypothetical protein
MASKVADSFGQMSAQKKQDDEYAAWLTQQQKARAEANANEERTRQQATAAQEAGLAQVSADAQKQQQATEQTRLTGYLNNADTLTADKSSAQSQSGDTSVSDQNAASGSQYVNDPTYKADYAARIAAAATEMKKRAAALATAASMTGSSGGADVTTNRAFLNAGIGGDLANSKRQGFINVYKAQQAIDPKKIDYYSRSF